MNFVHLLRRERSIPAALALLGAMVLALSVGCHNHLHWHAAPRVNNAEPVEYETAVEVEGQETLDSGGRAGDFGGLLESWGD